MKTLIACFFLSLMASAYGEDIPLRWIRAGYPAQSEVRDGVCVLYMQDQPRVEDMRHQAEPAIRKCMQAGGMLAAAPQGTIMLRWTVAPTQTELTAAHKAMHGKAEVNHIVYGVYDKHGEVCTVVTYQDRGSLGHEIKHCFDGDFHL